MCYVIKKNDAIFNLTSQKFDLNFYLRSPVYAINHYVILIMQSRNISIESSNSLMYVTFNSGHFRHRPLSKSVTFGHFRVKGRL